VPDLEEKLMLKKIAPITWLLLALADIGAKFFLLPDTTLTEIISIGLAITFGLGALQSLKMVTDTEGTEAC